MSIDSKVVSFERSAEYYHQRAMMNRRDNRPVDALELLRRAVEVQPDNQEYRLDLAELYCEMGCHQQSTSLLLDMLSTQDAPAECIYGLALNQLGMNDLNGARQSLNLYQREASQGEQSEDVSQLATELDFFSHIKPSSNRRTNRALSVANRACDALRDGETERACRLFERTLKMSPNQPEMRSLYALTLHMSGNGEQARKQAEQSVKSNDVSSRTLSVCAQILHAQGDDAQAVKLLDRAQAVHTGGPELRLLIYTAQEMGLHDRAAEYARLALQEAPFERELLHVRAVALIKSGGDESEAERCWERILRIDPVDTIARYYCDAIAAHELDPAQLGYTYEVPQAEYIRRLTLLSEALGEGYEALCPRWEHDEELRLLMRWAVDTEEPHLSRAAMTILATLEDESAKSALRSLMFAPQVPRELKLHAALLVRLQNRPLTDIMPKPMDASGEILVDADEILKHLPVGDRQVIRYADEVLLREFGIAARPVLALMWSTYRRIRGTKADPIRRVDSAAAALACNYLLSAGEKIDMGRLSKAFDCPLRQLSYYAQHITSRLD